MTTAEVAARFNELAKAGKWFEIQEELFHADAESIEPEEAQGLPSVKGKSAIRQKGEEFNQMVEEMHGAYASDPIVAGDHFSVAMGMDLTLKQGGRTKMDEIALYEVKDGKIIKEQFFYNNN